MPSQQHDAIIIGTGQAGPSLAFELAGQGWNVAVIEKKYFGGTCVNDGCTPTKALVASAKAAHMARRSADYGVSIAGDISINMKKVKARKDALVEASRNGLGEALESTENITVYKGHARFSAPKTVQVNDHELTADKIFINVGGHPFVPPGFEEVDYLTNTTMMDVDFVPEHLLVVGGSYIGLEFAQMYRRFGSEVTVIEMKDRVIGREDKDVSDAVQEILEKEGIHFRLQAECMTGKRHGDKIVVDVECEEGPPEVEGTHLLLATGRKPNTADLGLDKAGIETDERGFIKTDDTLQTNVEGIWAMGDCNGKGAFTHTAYNDYEIVSANLLHHDPRKVSDRIMCYALYTDPPLARIGMSENQVRESGRKALIGFRPMAKIARAKEKGETEGFVKILVDAETKHILGATILGVGGDEVIHALLDIMYAKAPYTVMQRAVHIHPTVSELLPTILGNLEPLE